MAKKGEKSAKKGEKSAKKREKIGKNQRTPGKTQGEEQNRASAISPYGLSYTSHVGMAIAVLRGDGASRNLLRSRPGADRNEGPIINIRETRGF